MVPQIFNFFVDLFVCEEQSGRTWSCVLAEDGVRLGGEFGENGWNVDVWNEVGVYVKTEFGGESEEW
jgi:hypothetical protein